MSDAVLAIVVPLVMVVAVLGGMALADGRLDRALREWHIRRAARAIHRAADRITRTAAKEPQP